MSERAMDSQIDQYNYLVRQHGGWIVLPESGLLAIEGRDRIDFIQRQTTNDLHSLQQGQIITTVLTSPTARILDVMRVFADGDRLLVIPLPGRARQTNNFLKSRIFFNDNVSIEDRSADIELIELLGTVSPDLLQQLDGNFDPTAGVQELSFGAGSATFLPQDPDINLGNMLLIDPQVLPAWQMWAADNQLVEITPEVREILRIETALPGVTSELSDSYTPLEIGLSNAISATKGCYTGQEIIARQITYDKIVKQLYRLRLTAEVSVGSALVINGTPAGEITSCVHSPRDGWIALAVLKTKMVTSETTIHVIDSPEISVTLQPNPDNA